MIKYSNPLKSRTCSKGQKTTWRWMPMTQWPSSIKLSRGPWQEPPRAHPRTISRGREDLALMEVCTRPWTRLCIRRTPCRLWPRVASLVSLRTSQGMKGWPMSRELEVFSTLPQARTTARASEPFSETVCNRWIWMTGISREPKARSKKETSPRETRAITEL